MEIYLGARKNNIAEGIALDAVRLPATLLPNYVFYQKLYSPSSLLISNKNFYQLPNYLPPFHCVTDVPQAITKHTCLL